MLTINTDRASTIYSWITTRGGLAVWKSISLSDPGKQLLTPALTDAAPTPRPHWSVAETPEIYGPDRLPEIIVSVDEEVKRFHIALRNTGLYIKLTDASSRKVRAEVARAGEGAYHAFDYSEQEAIIFRQVSTTPLSEYIESQKGVKNG